MSGEELSVVRFSAWAAGFTDKESWTDWANGKREMISGTDAPEIAFTDSLFRRRLSQISKMTIQVVHDLLPIGENTKMIFLSFRGELSKQFRINKTQIEEGALMPAAFSLSVFNAPPARASIALGLKGGYSALYPGENSFAYGLAAARAALLGAALPAEELLFVYADEEVPSEYVSLFPDSRPPFAFGFLLTRKPDSAGMTAGTAPLPDEGNDSPENFLKQLILCGAVNVSF